MSQDFRDLFAEFNTADVEYLVVGGHAFSYYYKPRFTKDLDVWVNPTPDNAQRVVEALVAFGAPAPLCINETFCKPGETMQLGVEPNRIDVLTEVTGLAFDEAWGRRVLGQFLDVPIFILSLEDLINNKEATGRPQDLLDAQNLRLPINGPTGKL